MKIGIDVGGTKTEGILLDSNGTEIDRKKLILKKIMMEQLMEYSPL